MNRNQLVELVAAEAGFSTAQTVKTLDALIKIVTEQVAQGENVALVGFGTFKSAARAERTGKNPKTGEALTIAATTVPKFVPGANFKTAVAAAAAEK